MNSKVIITAENQTGPGIESVKTSMAGLAVAVTAATAGLSLLIQAIAEISRHTIGLYKAQINVADSMDEMSVRTGMSIKDLTAWQAAAEMNGTTMESMQAGVRMLAKHMTENGEAFRAAGIDTKDANKAFGQISDLVKGMTDPVQRLDFVTRLFGRGVGQQLLPALMIGSEGLTEIRETTDRYSEALTQLSPESQKLNETLYLMGVEFKRAAAEGVFPLVKGFNDQMLPALREVAKEGSLLKTMLVGFGGVMKIVFTDPLNQKLLEAKASLQTFMSDVEGMLSKLTFGKASELHLRESQRMAEAAKKTLAEARGYAPEAPKSAPGLMLPGANTDAEAAALLASMKDKGGGGGTKAKTPLQRMIELGEKNLRESKQKEYQSVDDDEEARLGAHKRQMESLKLQDKEADAQEKLRKKYVEMADPLQKYRVQLDEINTLREKGVLTADQALAAEWAVNEAMDKTIASMDEMKDTGKDAFADLTKAIEGWGNKAADTFADFVVDGKASFSDLINSMLKDIVRLQAKSFLDPITKGASSWLSGAIGKGFEGMFNPSGSPIAAAGSEWNFGLPQPDRSPVKFASGGDHAGGWRIVGERGPELEATGPSRIFNAEQTQSILGGGITVNLIENGAKAGQVEQRRSGGQNMLDIFVTQIRSALASDIASGSGPVPQALANTYGLNRAVGGF